jgi:CRISPR system Cascade subunit CasA
MSGYLGAGNYGIARMNGGFGSRPVVALVPAGTWGKRWRSDVRRLLEIREELLGGAWPYQDRGLVLTWVPAWDRKSSLPLRSLDPFFIEVSRAVRLVQDKDRLCAYAAPSKAPRIAAREALGVLGDPWIPVKLDGQNGPQALTVGPAGLSAGLLRNLLFEDGFAPAAMQHPPGCLTEGPARFSVSVFVRGQGTTDGFQHEEIPIPAQMRTLLFSSGPEREVLATRSRRALEDAGLLEIRALKPAVLSFLEGAGGSQTLDWDQRQITTWWQKAARAFRASWSAELFPWLWRTTEEASDEEADRAWLLVLRESAQTVLDTVIHEYPRRQGRRFRSRAVAEDIFIGSLLKHFPQLKEVSRGATDN